MEIARYNILYRNNASTTRCNTQTRKRGHICVAAALIATDQLPLPPRRASANTTLVRNKCPSTSAAAKHASLVVERFRRLGGEYQLD